MVSFLMLGSLILGLTAWILPIYNFKKLEHKNWAALPFLSLIACAISLSFQLLYHHHLVKLGDWSALLDTSGTSIFLSFVLLIVTLLLNGITLMIKIEWPFRKHKIIQE